MAVIPPIMKYKDYWPSLQRLMDEDTPNAAIVKILHQLQILTAQGERYRQELLKKRAMVSRLELQRKAIELQIAKLERMMNQDAEIVDIWCIDYTLEIPVGTTIGTMEIPGEATKINIQRGYAEEGETEYDTALYNDVRDGMMQPIYASSLSGAAWFFNAAMKAAWQRWFPLFRYGKISEMIEQEDGTRNATIVLCPSTSYSTIQSNARAGDWGAITVYPGGLPIDQESILYDVPFQYMDCDDIAFDVEDDIVVEFREILHDLWKKELVDKEIRVIESYDSLDKDGNPITQGAGTAMVTVKAAEWVKNGLGRARDWSQPVIVGFQHDPQPCDIVFRVIITINAPEPYELDLDYMEDYIKDHPDRANLRFGYYGSMPIVFLYTQAIITFTVDASIQAHIDANPKLNDHLGETIESRWAMPRSMEYVSDHPTFPPHWRIALSGKYADAGIGTGWIVSNQSAMYVFEEYSVSMQYPYKFKASELAKSEDRFSFNAISNFTEPPVRLNVGYYREYETIDPTTYLNSKYMCGHDPNYLINWSVPGWSALCILVGGKITWSRKIVTSVKFNIRMYTMQWRRMAIYREESGSCWRSYNEPADLNVYSEGEYGMDRFMDFHVHEYPVRPVFFQKDSDTIEPVGYIEDFGCAAHESTFYVHWSALPPGEGMYGLEKFYKDNPMLDRCCQTYFKRYDKYRYT